MDAEKSLRSRLDLALRLHVLTASDDLLGVAVAALDGGATVIQLRDKTASTRTLIEEGMALRTLTRERGALLIVNDRLDVALAVDADGAHVGQDDMPAEIARHLLGAGRVLGVSAGTLEEAEQAARAGADYIGVGPIFPTPSKADAGPATGTRLLAQIARSMSIPLVAIGGITKENAAEVIRSGAQGIAVISAVSHAQDMTGATRQLRQIVDTALQAPR